MSIFYNCYGFSFASPFKLQRLVEVISMHRSSPDSIVYLTGDFNVFPGFEYSKPIRSAKIPGAYRETQRVGSEIGGGVEY